MSVSVQPIFIQTEPLKQSKKNNPDSFAAAAKQRMAEAKTGTAKVSDGAKPTMTDIHTMKRRAQQRQSTKIQAKMEGKDVTRQK